MATELGVAAKPGIRKRIVVIDDEAGPRESLRILLQPYYDVVCANSVKKGLDVIKDKKPDAIILDVRMPELDGMGGLKEIRKVDPNVSVIMLTAYSTISVAQQAMRLGANDYVEKPFDIADMIEVIQRNVDRSESERKREQLSRDLQELNRCLQEELVEREKFAELGQISSELFHDFANEIMALRWQVELFAKRLGGYRKPGDHPFSTDLQDFDNLEKNVSRCWDMIDLWHKAGQDFCAHMQAISAAEILEELAKSAKQIAISAGAEIRAQIHCSEINVRVDRLQIYRALSNLVVNAIQALRPEGGFVRISGNPKKDGVEIVIEDNGCGIQPDKITKIFEPFYTTKKGTGTGLGLNITRKIIEAHGGTIGVKSLVGVGTTFTIFLPATDLAPVE